MAIPPAVGDFPRFRSRVFRFTALAAAAEAAAAALTGDRRVLLGVALGAAAALVHVRLLGLGVGRFGRRPAWDAAGSIGRIAVVAGIVFTAVSQPRRFAWWAVLAGFLAEKPAFALAIWRDRPGKQE